MKCSRVRDKLMDYTSAELPPSEFQQMNEHLMACEDCRRELDLARDASSALEVLSGEAPTPALVMAVREKIDRGRATGRPVLVPRLAMGFSAAALIALAITGWLRFGSVDRTVITAVKPGSDQVLQNRSPESAKTPPAPALDADGQQPTTLALNSAGRPAVVTAKQGTRRVRVVLPRTSLGAEMTPGVMPEVDSEPVILFALQPKEPEIFVTHLDGTDGESPTELTVVREFDDGGNISSVTIEGTPSASSTGDVVPASDRTHLLDVPAANNLEARYPDAGGITRNA